MNNYQEIYAPEAVGCHEADTQFATSLVKKPLERPTNPAKTVLNAADFDGTVRESFYLWEEDNMPCSTSPDIVAKGIYDSPTFRPYVSIIPVPSDVPIRGAIVTASGGGWRLRANYTESVPSAEELATMGYLCFNVDYRIQPYTVSEAALDFARAIRFARNTVEQCGVPSDAIYALGFSAGGFTCAEALSFYSGDVNGTALDPNYRPDALDEVAATVTAVGLIYSHYTIDLRTAPDAKDIGPATDADDLIGRHLPPTFYSYGEADFLREGTEINLEAMKAVGLPCARLLLPDSPHGYGALGGWIPAFSRWLESL